MAPHSSTFAWKISRMEEPGRLQSIGSLRVGHDFSFSCIGEGNANPLQCSCLENPRDGGAWQAAICGVTQSRSRLKRLSSSSSTRDHCHNHWYHQRFLCSFFDQHILHKRKLLFTQKNLMTPPVFLSRNSQVTLSVLGLSMKVYTIVVINLDVVYQSKT